MTQQKLDITESGGTFPDGKECGRLWLAAAGPLLVFAVLLAITICATLYQRIEERDEARRTGEVVRTLVARRIERLTDDTLRPLRRLQIEFQQNGNPGQQAFADSVAPIVRLVAPYRTLAVVGPDGRIVAAWARPGGSDAVPVPGLDLRAKSGWRDAIDRSRAGMEFVAAELDSAEQHDPSSLAFVLPLKREQDGTYQGAIVGTVSIADLLHDLFDPRVALQFNVTLRDSREHLRNAQGDRAADWTAAITATEPVRILDSKWQLRVVPSVSYNRGLPVDEPVWIFIVGFVVSLLAAGTMLQAILYRRRERQRTRDQLRAMESLNQTAAALTAAPGGAELSLLAPLADEAKRLLRMPVGAVLLLEPGEPQMLRVVHSIGSIKPIKERLTLEEASGGRYCLDSGQVSIVPDVRRDAGPLNREQVDGYGFRSVVMVPLVVNGQPLGVIALSDFVPRHFTDLEIRMAHLYGAQAAVVLAQIRLNEQLRRQVDTNQTLLRELNHRVKNNLAGIHGLLVLDQPTLGAEGRLWLDRVVARVETMARAHELFSGGIDSVGMEDLVNKTLASIRAMKPPGVRFNVDLQELGQFALATDRAVTLAMVLNELCYNAIVHAVGRDGALTVRGRTAATPGMAAIDVIDSGGNDNGNGAAAQSHSVSSSGIGLSLVSQLVGRELQGKLIIDVARDGGTIATVEFPMARVKPDAGDSV